MQLLLRQELSPSDVAERLGITPTAVRQHLATLTALGMVERRRSPRGPSRPPEIYRLSVEGRRVFPKRYDLLLAGLIEVLLRESGKPRALQAVAAAARDIAAQIPRLPEGTGRDRWRRLLTWLDQEFAWEADEAGNESPSRLVVHQCPFQDVSARHPEVCGTFFSSLIESIEPGVSLAHLPHASGEACCAFAVRRRGQTGVREDVRT